MQTFCFWIHFVQKQTIFLPFFLHLQLYMSTEPSTARSKIYVLQKSQINVMWGIICCPPHPWLSNGHSPESLQLLVLSSHTPSCVTKITLPIFWYFCIYSEVIQCSFKTPYIVIDSVLFLNQSEPICKWNQWRTFFIPITTFLNQFLIYLENF